MCVGSEQQILPPSHVGLQTGHAISVESTCHAPPVHVAVVGELAPPVHG
jgi:hypothetical protein